MSPAVGRVVAGGVVAVGCALALAACLPQQQTAPGSSTPPGPGVEELTAALEAIPHVEDVEYDYQSADVNQGGFNDATLTVDPEADALCVLDQAMATLWFGRPTSTAVTVVQGDREVTREDLGLEFGDRMELEERYGEPPAGGGTPDPTTLPACG